MAGVLILAVLVVFVAVIAVRTLRFKPAGQPAINKETYHFDENAAVDALAQLVRCKTISYNDHSLEDDAEFNKLISLLQYLLPVEGNYQHSFHLSR